MITMVGWFENQDSATLVGTAALADQHVRVVGDDIVVPSKLNKLAGAYAWGADLSQAQLSSPSLRRRALLDLEPWDSADEPTSNPPWHNWFEHPIILDESEALNFNMAEDNAGAGDGACFVWLMDEIEEIPEDAQIFTVRCTNTTTLVADTWTNGALTFSQTLPAGKYGCCGAYATSAGLRAFRFNPVGHDWRPGAIGFDTGQDYGDPIFRYGGLGKWFEFEHDSPPTVDFMSLSADTAQVVYMDLYIIRAGKST
jgi:hypothetical protein